MTFIYRKERKMSKYSFLNFQMSSSKTVKIFRREQEREVRLNMNTINVMTVAVQ